MEKLPVTVEDPTVKPITAVEREVVENIIHLGMEWEEAYAVANGMMEQLNDETRADFKKKCNSLIQKPQVFAYYNAIQAEVLEYQTKKSAWTKELAEQKLMNLVNRIEQELDGGAKVTMTRVQGILQPIKELNLMNGFNEVNLHNNTGVVVQFIGEDNIPK